MPNILDYVQWRGDLGFEERPFTETDNLVLCQLAYIDFRPVFPEGDAPGAQESSGLPEASPEEPFSDPVNSAGQAVSLPRASGARITLRDAVERLLAREGHIDTLLVDGEEKAAQYTDFARAAAASHRFGDLIMEDYVDIRDDSLQTQFAAVTFHLDERTDFIAFRGTDDSIVGWKEDFMISFTRVAAQDFALEYLRRHVFPRKKHDSPCQSDAADGSGGSRTGSFSHRESGNPDEHKMSDSANSGRAKPQEPPRQNQFYVGGHSKGANLALYAAAMLLRDIGAAGAPSHEGACAGSSRKTAPAADSADSKAASGAGRILRVYVNDGPGLCSDVMDPALTEGVDPIATKIVPEYDVIGKIFEMPITDNRIVRSSGSGVMQHGMITWQLREGGELDCAEANDPASIWIGEVLEKWIGGVDTDSRKTFVDEVFAILGAGGNATFSEMGELGPDGLEAVLEQVTGTSRITWDVARSLPRAAATGVGQDEHVSHLDYIRGLFQPGTYTRGLALLAAGILCLLMPGRLLPLSINAVIIAFLVYEVWYLLKRLKAADWNLRAVQMQFFILLFSLAAWFVVITKENLLLLLSNLVYGGIFLFLSYRSFSREGRPGASEGADSESAAAAGGASKAPGSGNGETDTEDHSKYEKGAGQQTTAGDAGRPAHPLQARLPRYWNLIEGGFLLLLAVVMLTAPFDVITVCTFILGAILVIDGIVHLAAARRARHGRRKPDSA